MKHLYIEGQIREVSAERASNMVDSGEWYWCTATGHDLKGKYDPDEVTIYHRNHNAAKKVQP